MAIYYIADLHLGHENVLKFDSRPFDSIEEHDNCLIENWNHIVTPQDSVYILGDFSWKNAKETENILRNLNGAKFLIKGNHDHWCKDGTCKKLLQGIYDYKVIVDENRAVVMCHYPILFYQGQHRNSIHLYGHVHNSREEMLFQSACRNIANTTDIPMDCHNVGCMNWHYEPVTLDHILHSRKKGGQ